MEVRTCVHEHLNLDVQKYAMGIQVWLLEFVCKFGKCVRKCRCTKFHTSAHVKMCAKVGMFEISHTLTPSHVQNMCNVHGVAAGVFFAKYYFGNVCESVDVRNFARLLTHTHSKCVQFA